MGFKKTNRMNKTSKKQDKPARQRTGIVEAQADDLGFRMLSAISIAAVIGSLLFLAFFFSSDVRGNILAAKATLVHAEQSSTPENTRVSSVTDSAPDLVDALSDPDVSREDATTHREQASETDNSLQESLEDAYTEAERLHPGQIDGSKRLKLIKDLNATDYMYYVAEEGDTLIKLSRAFHVPLGQLVELNGIHNADVIPAGMILLFPVGTEQPDTETGEK